MGGAAFIFKESNFSSDEDLLYLIKNERQSLPTGSVVAHFILTCRRLDGRCFLGITYSVQRDRLQG